MPDFRKGIEAIEDDAQTGRKFQPFTPQINWKDGDEKFIRFLTSIDEVTTILLHEWIDCGTKKIGDKEFTDWGFFMSRKDPAIDEDTDPLEKKGSSPKKRRLAVAVELVPIMDESGTGRARPSGFEVKTQEYTRKTDDGDEVVTAPVIGVLTQASKNFFKLLVSHSQSEGPIESTAFKVRRVGGDSETAYAFTPYFDKPIDMSELVDNVHGVSYLTSDEDSWTEVEAALDLGDDDERSMAIGAILLNKRLNELADKEYYDEKTGHIEKIESRYGNDKGGKKDRPARQSQREGNAKSDSPDDKAKASSERFADIKRLADKKKREREASAA